MGEIIDAADDFDYVEIPLAVIEVIVTGDYSGTATPKIERRYCCRRFTPDMVRIDKEKGQLVYKAMLTKVTNYPAEAREFRAFVESFPQPLAERIVATCGGDWDYLERIFSKVTVSSVPVEITAPLSDCISVKTRKILE